jgi:hypothetical protein
VTSWGVVLVNSGVETVRIMRRKQVVFEGSLPAGFTRTLFLGDSVLVKRPRSGGKWLKKFSVCLFRGHPSLHFGRSWGRKDCYVRLDRR